MKKFSYAFSGLINALREKSILIQFILGFLAIMGGIIIKLQYFEWLAFFICIALVISLEIINSCIEKICDLYKKEYDERIKIIKDYASASVLVACIFAFIICLFVIVRRLL